MREVEPGQKAKLSPSQAKSSRKKIKFERQRRFGTPRGNHLFQGGTKRAKNQRFDRKLKNLALLISLSMNLKRFNFYYIKYAFVRNVTKTISK